MKEADESQEITKYKQKIQKLTKKNTEKQESIYNLRKRIKRLQQQINKMNRTAGVSALRRKQFGELKKAQQYRYRQRADKYLKHLHSHDPQQVGVTLSKVADGAEEISTELSQNAKIRDKIAVWCNQFTKKMMKEDNTIIRQTIVKYLSGVSEKQCDSIRFGVNYHRDVIIDAGIVYIHIIYIRCIVYIIIPYT